MKEAKIVEYKGKEYKYMLGEEAIDYCDFCAFYKLCAYVCSGKLAEEDSPMHICIKLSEEFDTHFANFQEYNKE